MIGEITESVSFPCVSAVNLIDDVNQPKLETFVFPRVRSVKWLHKIPIAIEMINPKLMPLFCSQHAISDVSENYARYFEQALYPLYFKDDKYHLTIPVTGDSKSCFDISAYRSLFDDIDVIRDEFSSHFGIDVKSQQIGTGIQIQSPGFMTFIAENKIILLMLAAWVVSVSGGEFNLGISGLSLKSNYVLKDVLAFFATIQKQKYDYEINLEKIKLENRKMDVLETIVSSMDFQAHPSLIGADESETENIYGIEEENTDRCNSDNSTNIK